MYFYRMTPAWHSYLFYDLITFLGQQQKSDEDSYTTTPFPCKCISTVLNDTTKRPFLYSEWRIPDGSCSAGIHVARSKKDLNYSKRNYLSLYGTKLYVA